MQLFKDFEEFAAAAERIAAGRQDQGLGYDIAGAILRALHDRVSALETVIAPHVPESGQAPEAAEPGQQ